MRTSTTLLGLVGLLCGFVQAPFLHFHGEERCHPATTIAHLHIHALQKTAGLQIEAHTGDDDAIDAGWHATPPAGVAFAVDTALSSVPVIEPPRVGSDLVSMLRPRGHDPPPLVPSQPRSPPA